MVVATTRTILEMSADEARVFLLSPKSYCDLDLPRYFDFTPLLENAMNVVTSGMQFRKSRPNVGNLSKVNHLVLDNKDGAYSWRPMQLVHPVIYAQLVDLLTKPANWQVLQDRFVDFQSDKKIVCKSIPLSQDSASNKVAGIRNWWLEFEQESIRLSMDFKYLASTDITDCYGALYTHSIAWAVHGRGWAKSNRRGGLGNELDKLCQDMHERQTNGIPQGNSVSDLLAEIVLGYADLKLSEELRRRQTEDYQILRFRDDYRIFTNSREDAQEILLVLTGILSELNFKLSGPKTRISDDIISSSIKPDKYYWNQASKSRRNAFKSLLLVRELGRRFPNSGSLVIALNQFRKVIERRSTKPSDNDVLISIVVDIMHSNPRVYPHVASILSRLLSFEEVSTVEEYLGRIRRKFMDTPNTGFLDIWMQRIAIGYELEESYQELLCRVVEEPSVSVWNSDWLTDAAKDACFGNVDIVDRTALADMGRVISIEETDLFVMHYGESADPKPENPQENDDCDRTPET